MHLPLLTTILADAARSITKAIESNNLIRLTCWYHLMAALKKRLLKNDVKNDYKEQIFNGIRIVQLFHRRSLLKVNILFSKLDSKLTFRIFSFKHLL
jgi:hypothetical protein